MRVLEHIETLFLQKDFNTHIKVILDDLGLLFIESNSGNEIILPESNNFSLISLWLEIKLLRLDKVQIHLHNLSSAILVPE